MKYKVTVPEHDLKCILRDIVTEERNIENPEISFYFSAHNGDDRCFDVFAEIEWEEIFV